MRGRTRKIVVGLAVVGALVLGGTALARATGAFDDEQQLVGPQADRARAAALRATGGGTANAVERDSEDGATYEVEVTKKNGSTVDVRLDESFGVVVIEGDSEGEDSDGDEDE
ncbi:MAG: PepSY domain-containing protein [Actinobacteria bacterium]|nr:PepSY domain-containing protein [Actinomycetota bacterium]